MKSYIIVGFTIVLCDRIRQIDIGFVNDDFSFLVLGMDNNCTIRTPADTDEKTGKYLSDILGISQEEAEKVINAMRPPMPKPVEKKEKDGD